MPLEYIPSPPQSHPCCCSLLPKSSQGRQSRTTIRLPMNLAWDLFFSFFFGSQSQSHLSGYRLDQSQITLFWAGQDQSDAWRSTFPQDDLFLCSAFISSLSFDPIHHHHQQQLPHSTQHPVPSFAGTLDGSWHALRPKGLSWRLSPTSPLIDLIVAYGLPPALTP